MAWNSFGNHHCVNNYGRRQQLLSDMATFRKLLGSDGFRDLERTVIILAPESGGLKR